jgi:hypothetical protein
MEAPDQLPSRYRGFSLKEKKNITALQIFNEWHRFRTQIFHGILASTILIIVVFQALQENINELDSLHHGLIFPAAIAVRHGLFPNLDAFAQYGPINPILQGNWLKVVGARVFDMQLFTLLIAILLGLLIFFICRYYIGNLTSGLIALAWFMTGPQGLPWASLPANLLILTSAAIVIWNTNATPRKSIGTGADLIAGVLLALGTFTRIQTIIVVGLVFLALISINRRRALFFAMGSAIGLFSFIGYLHTNNALIPYINECIIWTSKTLGLAEVQPISISYLFELSWFLWTALFFGGVIALLNMIDVKPVKYKNAKRYFVFLLTLIFIIFGYISNLSFEELLLRVERPLLNPEYLLLTLSRKILFTMDFAPLLIFVGLGLFLLISRYRSRTKLKDDSKLALAFGAACLSQTFPISDSYHMWFLGPILISCIIIFKGDSIEFNWKRNLNIFLITLMVGLQVQSVIDLQKTRYSFTNYTLSGMKSSLTSAPDLDKTMNQLETLIGPGSTRFICPDGIYSAVNGDYNSVDSNFVNWSSKSGTNLTNYEFIFLCRTTSQIIEDYEQKNWDLVFKIPFGPGTESFNVLLRKNS